MAKRKAKSEEESKVKQEATTCSACKYLAYVPKNPADRPPVPQENKKPSCCFQMAFSLTKDMTSCDGFTRIGE